MLRDWGQYQGSKKRMKEQARLFSQDIKQINQDVNRTFRNHIMFWNRDGIKQQALFHVLAAYSVYNTEVGYCQGVSEVAAVLLMFLGEEDAFWALAQLMVSERHAMHDPLLTHPEALGRLHPEGTPPEAASGRPAGVSAGQAGQPWALEDNAMLRHLQALMVELQRMKCDLPSPEEFPTVPLGLERASPEPRPVLASPSCEKLPSEARLALPAYPSSTSGQDPRPPRLSPRPRSCSIRGPPRGPWLLTPLSEPQRLRVCPACPRPRTALGIGCSHGVSLPSRTSQGIMKPRTGGPQPWALSWKAGRLSLYCPPGPPPGPQDRLSPASPLGPQ
ncbi:TBC1 domain family member 3K isoform X4 [Equus caballus]|uniref:Rab-GAP TBC domain-containing protein n=1 Tax=Equus caballus TaxID=9796 RepID=A0A3Q2I1L1_HORSE